MKNNPEITREELVKLLNEDLSREYQAVIAYTVYSQILKGAAYTDIARELRSTLAKNWPTPFESPSRSIIWAGRRRCRQARGTFRESRGSASV